MYVGLIVLLLVLSAGSSYVVFHTALARVALRWPAFFRTFIGVMTALAMTEFRQPWVFFVVLGLFVGFLLAQEINLTNVQT